MKQFKDIITLNKNSRGCYILDTVKGCSGCNESRPHGCYGDCYANNIAARYAIDFQHPVSRVFDTDDKQLMFFDFKDEHHLSKIIRDIKNIKMPFVRIGEMGDPSEDWNHTINVCGAISMAGKPIVIITKHWKTMPDLLLEQIRLIDLCINTSISAMDTDYEISHRLEQYERLKPYCNSVLRIVSCDFNTDTQEGARMASIQRKLFKNENTLDTIFRPGKNNKMVLDGIIKVGKARFMRSEVQASIYNDNPYLGMCDECPDMCGTNK